MHTPVLLQQVIENLNIKKDGLYIDATFGEGGYSQEIVRLGGKVLAIDFDKKQIDRYNAKTPERLNNFKLAEGNFADIEKIAKNNKIFSLIFYNLFIIF